MCIPSMAQYGGHIKGKKKKSRKSGSGSGSQSAEGSSSHSKSASSNSKSNSKSSKSSSAFNQAETPSGHLAEDFAESDKFTVKVRKADTVDFDEKEFDDPEVL